MEDLQVFLNLYKVIISPHVSDLNSEQEQQNEPIVKFELMQRIEIPKKYMYRKGDMNDHHFSPENSGEQTSENTLIFDNINKKDSSKCILHVDNHGNVIFINESHKLMMLNKKEVWERFQKNISFKKSLDQVSILKFGQGIIAMKKGEAIYWMSYSDGGFSKPKLLGHKIFESSESKLLHMILPVSCRHIILIYQFSQVVTIVIWDIEKDIEHTNFLARQGDVFTDYLSYGKSWTKDSDDHRLGHACFIQHQSESSSFKDLHSLYPASEDISHYIVDLNTGVPNPFIKVDSKTPEHKWGQGSRISRKGDLILNDGNLITTMSHRDIKYHKQHVEKNLDMIEFQKIVIIVVNF